VDERVIRALEAVAAVRRDEPLSRHTTIGIGGPTDAFVTVQTASELSAVLRVAHEAGVAVFMLGSGSNIVVGDLGIRGIVIENKAGGVERQEAGGRRQEETIGDGGASHLTPATARPSPTSERGSGRWDVGSGEDGLQDRGRFLFRIESGASFAAVARQLAFAGYAGLEWACGIPGTLGGAVVYNAGAYGGCLGDVLERIAVWDGERGEAVIEASQLGLVYRGSAFTRGVMAGKAVLWAEVALWAGDAEALRARVGDYDARRLKAQPRGRNAGSFFKNPPGQPAWRLIDAVGLRGHRVGGAEFSEKHCNFLINAGGATAADVVALKELAQSRIREQFGVELENEVTLVGEF
jgi:UDP-N-acetylmuramate dehydrogenase